MNYVLQWSTTGEGFPEVETFPKLLPALIRLQQLADESDGVTFVADIYLDTQDHDGQIHEIVFFNLSQGFQFEEQIADFIQYVG
jgi:hypothetical protein